MIAGEICWVVVDLFELLHFRVINNIIIIRDGDREEKR
jgi:hypothetical protein